MSEPIKAMVVDDSSFSIKILTSLLESLKIDIVYSATTVEQAIELAKTHRPDLITMDITLPDGNGLDCAERILDFLPNSNIIFVSSMKDPEIISRATRLGITDFIQKPIEKDEFNSAIEKIYNVTILYEELKNTYKDAFSESLVTYLQRATSDSVECKESYKHPSDFKSSGLSVTIGFSGVFKGRMIIDTDIKTARNISFKEYNTENISYDEIVEYWVETTNVIAGNAISLLNSINRAFGLRVAPPTVFHGEDLNIVLGNIESTSFNIKTDCGDLYINVNFQKEKDNF